MIQWFLILTAFCTVYVVVRHPREPGVLTQIKCIPQLCVDSVHSLTSAKKELTNFKGHQEQEDEQEEKNEEGEEEEW